MSINVNEDVIGSGGLGSGLGGGYGGIILIAIILVLVAMGGGFFGRGRDGFDGHGHGHGGWNGMIGNCAPICKPVEDVAVAGIAKEIACTTGQIKTQNAMDTGAIIHALDQQTCEIKLGEAAIIQNALNIAREQEVMALNGKIADLRDCNLELKGKLLQQETVNTINAGNSAIRHELDGIRCSMVKQPPVYGAVGFPHTNPFNFQPTAFPFDGRRDGFRDGNCCY